MNISQKINPFFRIIRPLNTILSGIGVYVGMMITLGLNLVSREIIIISIGAVIMMCVSAGGFVINDIFDIEIDKINAPSRVLPAGLISVQAAYIYTAFLFILAFLLSVIALQIETTLELGLIPPLITLVGIFSLVLYAGYLKRLSIVGNILIALLTTIPLTIGGIFINDFNRSLFPVLVAFLLMYSRELIKDIEDIKGDIEGTNGSFFSLPALIGVKNSVSIVLILLFFVISSSFLPVILINDFEYYLSYSILFFVLIVDVIILYVIYSLLSHRNSGIKLNGTIKTSSKLLKICIILGLVSFSLNEFTSFNGL